MKTKPNPNVTLAKAAEIPITFVAILGVTQLINISIPTLLLSYLVIRAILKD